MAGNKDQERWSSSWGRGAEVQMHGDRAPNGNGHGSWVVLLEAVPSLDAPGVDIGTAERVLRTMGDEDGIALHAPSRLAVQVGVEAPDAARALSAAFVRWEAAVRFAPAGWDVVRAEVLTPEEFKRDCQLA